MSLPRRLSGTMRRLSGRMRGKGKRISNIEGKKRKLTISLLCLSSSFLFFSLTSTFDIRLRVKKADPASVLTRPASILSLCARVSR